MKRLNLSKLPWLNRLGLVVGGTVAAVASFAVASLLFIVLLAVGGAVAIWVWWTYRQMIKQTRKLPPGLIEGEYRVEPAQLLLEDQRPPARRSRPKRKSRRDHP
jgi:hypothetical protein